MSACEGLPQLSFQTPQQLLQSHGPQLSFQTPQQLLQSHGPQLSFQTPQQLLQSFWRDRGATEAGAAAAAAVRSLSGAKRPLGDAFTSLG